MPREFNKNMTAFSHFYKHTFR